MKKEFKIKFPSPLGVIFSLIILNSFLYNSLNNLSFRLLSELYSLLLETVRQLLKKDISIVSVSSRSYILSYLALRFLYLIY